MRFVEISAAQSFGGIRDLGQFSCAERMPERLQTGFRLCAADSRFQPAYEHHPVRVEVVQVLPARRDDVLRSQRDKGLWRRSANDAVKSRWRDAYDGERMCVDEQGLVDHARIGAELPLPVVVAEHDYRTAVGYIVGGKKQPPQCRLQSQRL